MEVAKNPPIKCTEDRSQGNSVLYTGLIMASVGLVITFVGLGEKGFQTIELKLIGPSMVGCGLILVFLRIIYFIIISIEKDKDSEKLMEKEETPTKHSRFQELAEELIMESIRHNEQKQNIQPYEDHFPITNQGPARQSYAESVRPRASPGWDSDGQVFLNSRRLFVDK